MIKVKSVLRIILIGLIVGLGAKSTQGQNVRKPEPIPLVDQYIKIADALFEKGNYHGGAFYYEKAIEQDSITPNYYAIFKAGECYKIKRLYHSAEKWYGVVARKNFEHFSLIEGNDSLASIERAYKRIYQEKSAKNAALAIEKPSKYNYYDSLAKHFDLKAIASDAKIARYDSTVKANKKLYMYDYPMVMFKYALMQKANGKYYDAKQSFIAFSKMYKGNNIHIKSRVRQEIHGMEFATAWIEFNYPYEIEILSRSINDTFSDFSPIKLDQNTLAFTSTYRMDEKKKIKATKANARKQNITYSPFLNRIFLSTKTDSGWSEREMLDLPDNSEITHIGNANPTKGGDRLYFTICQNLRLASEFKEQCHIYYTNKTDDGWSKAELVGFGVNKDSTSSKNPFVYEDIGDKGDREIMIFTSDRKGGVGGYDLWYSVLNDEAGSIEEKGEGKAVNLGRVVNTYYDEVTPYYDYESDVLYFSSNGHLGLGEFDIFKSNGTRQKNNWGRPENLGYPINSGADDYYYYQNKGTDEIFFASNRSGGIVLTESTCCDDIYNIPSTSLVWSRYFAKGKVIEKLNGIEAPLKGLALSLYYIDTATNTRILIKRDTLSSLASAPDYLFEVNPNESYMIEASKPGFLNNKVEFNTYNLKQSDTVEVDDIELTRIKKGDKFVLEYIYYDLNKATLRQESYLALDNLVFFMYENPGLKIELSAHTDSRGSKIYNQELSQKRAESVVDYLILNGIESERLVSKGYGETKLVNKCSDGVECTEGEHQANRRTEVEVLDYDTTVNERLFSRKVEGETKTETIDLKDKEHKNKVLYLVQVGVYDTDNPIKVAKLLDLGEVTTDPVGNGLYRFYLGPYESKEEAEEINEQVKTRMDDSRIVPTYNGQRITMQRAFRIENN